MEGGSGYDCDDEDGCEASGENRGESLTHTHTRAWCCVLMLRAHWSLANRDMPGLEGESGLRDRPPPLNLSLPFLLPLYHSPRFAVSAGLLLLLLSAGITDALTSRSPQKGKSKNNKLLFIYPFLTYLSCLRFRTCLMTIQDEPWEPRGRFIQMWLKERAYKTLYLTYKAQRTLKC